MLASVLISAVSVALLIYWFRYSCLLLIRTQGDESTRIEATRLDLFEIQERVRTEADLDPLHRALERDYRLLTYLLQHAARLGSQSLESRLLILDYKLM